jgi:hypothetical protein
MGIRCRSYTSEIGRMYGRSSQMHVVVVVEEDVHGQSPSCGLVHGSIWW